MKIKPFDMEYKDYKIRVTRISRIEGSPFADGKYVYSFDLILKRNGKSSLLKDFKLNANEVDHFRIVLQQNLLKYLN